jgi:hypothetical protein
MVRTVRGKVPRVRQKWREPLAFKGPHQWGGPAGNELVIDWSIEAVLFGNCNCDYF